MKIISISGEKISTSQLIDLYQLRLSILPLKSTVNQNKDYSYFCTYARTSQQIFIFQNKKKEIKGFYFCKYRKIKLPSKTFIRLEPEYGIIDKSYRGRANTFLPIAKVTLYLIFRYPLYPIYFVGTTYPSSYILLQKQMDKVFDSTESLDSTNKAVFLNYANSMNSSLLENSYIYDNPTIPELSDEVLARYEKSPYYLRFKQLNPKWQDGKSLIIVCPINKMKVIKRVTNVLLKKK